MATASAASEDGWTDITSDILAACKELSEGEMLHDDTFSLFHAMSGLELMDPKMVCLNLHVITNLIVEARTPSTIANS